MICSTCNQVIPITTLASINKRAPANERKYFCSRKCFYIDYIQHGPHTPTDHNFIWPVFEIAKLSFDDCVNLMCCYDELSHILAKHFDEVAVSRLMALLLFKYEISHLEHCLTILLSIVFDHNQLMKIVSMPV